VSTTAEQTAAWLRQRDAARRDLAVARAEKLRTLLHAVVVGLKSDFGCTRVELFGSLATGDVHADSDVDLFVEGLPAARQFEAMAFASSRLGVQVDLVRAEDAPASLAQRVRAEGRPL
jgi:predicted nucleotidyltransferase